MPHLAEHAAVGARDALDGQYRSVGVHIQVHRRHAVHVDVLRGDLPRRFHLLDEFGRSDEAAFAMADGHGMHISHLAARKPRREARSHTRAHETALMTPDGVVGERRTALVHRTNVAERHQPQLHQRLKAVADAEHEPVAVLEQVAHRFGHGRSAEERRDEFSGAVGFIAAGEAAGKHDDLAVLDGRHKRLGTFGNAVGREVVHHEHIGNRSRALERTHRIVFAVRSREHGNDDARFRDNPAVGERQRVGIAHRLDLGAFAAVREYGFELALPRFLQFNEIDRLPRNREHVV